MTELATTTGAAVATGGSFLGADVDGLDHLAKEFEGAAEIVDMVKTACEVIVAAASIFGPFGAAFVAYLKSTVIPWLSKISMALKAMAKLLSVHSQAQRETSSSTTSLNNTVTITLPSYPGTPNLPTTSTAAPTLPAAVTPTTPAPPTTTTPAGAGSAVATPPTIGATTDTPAAASTGATTGSTATAGAGTTPFVQAVTALTGLVTAVDHLVHPGATATTTPTTPTTDTPTTDSPTTDSPTTDSPGTTDPVTATPPTLGGTGGSGAPAVGGIDLSTLHPLHPGDTVGVLSIPVDVAPDGTVTPLLTGAGDTPALPGAGDTGSTPAADAPTATVPSSPTDTGPTDTGPTDTGPTGTPGAASGDTGGGTGGGSGGSAAPDTTPTSTADPTGTTDPGATAVTTAAHPAAAHPTTQADPQLRTERIGSHDGLFGGLGQAAGIGAGAAALARAVLTEARQGGDGALLGAVPLPFEAGADDAAQAQIYQGAIG
ncbi:hypothetical protein SAMN05443575_3144 [Jatrophihabitans endophyticus]|uniref:Uncharacterized protein n=1 Tax=Jatrophihabitans endophyticus TaxID=1206085 RepID=A0A1M5PNU7_9ACTN|nr:hypothetical protein [Jatrophihabitans endophyticus]SHH03361.1 hypothetical protein SAMN05443575_3144 [Jatrophihabitans endophyticus]